MRWSVFCAGIAADLDLAAAAAPLLLCRDRRGGGGGVPCGLTRTQRRDKAPVMARAFLKSARSLPRILEAVAHVQRRGHSPVTVVMV